jgi:hypothetical protein
MSRRLALLSFAVLAGCARDRVTVSGTVADDEGLTAVWLAGDTLRTPIDSGSFRLRRPAADSLTLRFARGDDSASMRIVGLTAGAALTLDGVWAEEGVAYPARIGLRGDPLVVINELRMAGDESLPPSINVPATVIAVADKGDALLVRPTTGGLPDLRVVLTPTSVVRAESGDTLDAADLEYGDSLRLSGAISDGYVAATEAAVAPGAAARMARREEQRRAEAARRAAESAREDEEESEEEAGPSKSHRNFLERLLGIHRGERKEGKKGKPGGKH